MDEAIIGIVLMAIGIIGTVFVCRRGPNGRTGTGIGSDPGSVGDNIEAAGRRNNELKDAERATSERLREQAESIERAGSNNKDAQQLVQKAKHILNSAKRTD